ncbi:MAG TPA: SMI1/KNR4 family protein [Humisphaera sp.]
MWSEVVEKIGRLRGVDKQYQAFGAGTHRYEIRPQCAERQLAGVEARLGVRLPDDLRSFYATVGNGIVGPNYGLCPAEKVTGHRPADPYPGVAALRQAAIDAGGSVDNPPGYFEAPRDALAGLVAVIDVGCGHQVCLATNGPCVGQVVYVSGPGQVTEPGVGLVQLYHQWLDRELLLFAEVRRLMTTAATLDQVCNEMATMHRDYHAGERIVSIANVPKPANLFGGGGVAIHHGATQFPWYEGVLDNWRRQHPG